MTTTRERLPLFGTFADQREAALALAGSWLITELYSRVASSLDTPTSRLEYVSLIFSFACVWLSRTENVLSMHTGIVSSIVMGIFLLRVDLVGQGWIQFAFYVPVQLIGWHQWCRGGENKTELPVSPLSQRGWAMSLALLGAVWVSTRVAFGIIYENPRLIWWDTSIVAASIVAQSLMTVKKVECWVFWIVPVNISSIALYVYSDIPAFAVMYGIFLANALWGWRSWAQAGSADKE